MSEREILDNACSAHVHPPHQVKDPSSNLKSSNSQVNISNPQSPTDTDLREKIRKNPNPISENEPTNPLPNPPNQISTQSETTPHQTRQQLTNRNTRKLLETLATAKGTLVSSPREESLNPSKVDRGNSHAQTIDPKKSYKGALLPTPITPFSPPREAEEK